MFTNIHRFYHPEIFQGNISKKNYFEGWYFKQVSADGSQAFAVIPGISIDDKGSKRAFIQILDGTKRKAIYEFYDIDQFSSKTNKFEFNIGNNFFSADGIKLDTPQLKGEIRFSKFHKWPKSLFSPGTMGWYSFMPFMECYHEVISMHHSLNGILEYEGRTISFENGNGYFEKDWGRSFPKTWIWTQCNNFVHSENISAMVSVADIPWVKNHFIGYLGGLQINEEFFMFTTYNSSKINVELNDTQVKLELYNRKHRMVIYAEQSPGADLFSPIEGAMTGKVNESLLATHELEFFINGNSVLSAIGHSAGLEVTGPVDVLLEGLN